MPENKIDYFDRAVAFVLKREGGYVNNPNDPGGETKYGISKRAFPELDIKKLTEEDAKKIYRTKYWDTANCGSLSWPLALVHFDTAVNMGLRRASGLFTKVAARNDPKQGHIYIPNPDWRDYLKARREFYNKLGKKRPRFLKGWLNRCDELEKEAQRAE